MSTYKQRTDGRSVTADLYYYNFNNGQTYTASKAKRSKGATVTKSYNTAGFPSGFQVKDDFTEGSIDFTLVLVTDEDRQADGSLPTRGQRNGDLIKYKGAWYTITKVDTADEKGAASTGTISILKNENPVFEDLCSVEGDYKAFTKTVGSAWTGTYLAKNTRAGATLSYALEDAPAGMTIVAATGVINWPTPVVGTYYFGVVVTDSLPAANPAEDDKAQRGNIKLTVT